MRHILTHIHVICYDKQKGVCLNFEIPIRLKTPLITVYNEHLKAR